MLQALQPVLLNNLLRLRCHLLIQLAFPIHLAQMTLLFQDQFIFLLVGYKSSSENPSIVALTPPTQISHRFCHDNVWTQLKPQLTEGGGTDNS
ncbi:hypothetical protein ACOMHN_019788 [Nucella lapillus]